MEIPIRKRKSSLYINNNFVSCDFSTEYIKTEFGEDVKIETFEKVKVLSFLDEDTGKKEFINAVREELLEHGYLYDAFLASITSSVDESRHEGVSNKKLAEKILKRIIGEE